MKKYILPFGIYVLTVPILSYFFKVENQAAFAIKYLVAFALLIYFWKEYKLKFKFELLPILTGLLIFLVWIGLENHYPLLYQTSFAPNSSSMLFFKLFGFVIVAPLIEEIFTRGFLIRIISKSDYEKVSLGKFTWVSFIITVLFFGFSHNRWLVGLITGVLLNLLYYNRKNISSTIIAHFVANLILAIYIVHNSYWVFW